jgi:hypothetical protein
MDLIQQWGIRFEGDQSHPIFTKLYNGLKVRMNDFPDEHEMRKKLGMPIQTPVRQPPSVYSQQQSSLDEISVQDRSRKKNRKKGRKKEIRLNDTQKMLKTEIDNIVENINLTNSMIDNDQSYTDDGLDLVVDMVNSLKEAESKLIETISNVDQADLVDYAIKVNDDFQSTLRRYRQLKKGRRPEKFLANYKNNNFDNPPEEEVKLDMSEDSMSEVHRPSR